MAYLTARMDKPGKLTLLAEGAWIAANAETIEETILSFAKQTQKGKDVEINLKNVREFDTYGAWLLERLGSDMTRNGKRPKLTGLHARNTPLFKEVARASSALTEKQKDRETSISTFQKMADALMSSLRDFSLFVVMFGAILAAMGRMIRHPGQYRLTSTIYQMERVGWKALPIVLMVTFIIGAIIAQQGFFHFRRFGADLYVVDMIGFLIMREIGVLLVAIVIAGRSGSSYTAELGSMKMSEEIDALKTMGFDPVEVLLLPRVLVLVIALPVLTFIGSLAALFGAGLVATTYAGMTTDLFMQRLNEAITMDHFLVGLIKSPFIGLVIGIISCVEGLQVKGSATSLGHHTTKAVVESIFMVIVLDGLFALFFSAISM
jgi:phospholipid/cholesterol/gamma-HCH transport system permease protein